MAIQNKLQFVARFDNLDPNENVGDNVINKYVLASSYFFNKNTRIQVEYDFVREQTVSQIKNNLLAIMDQFDFELKTALFCTGQISTEKIFKSAISNKKVWHETR